MTLRIFIVAYLACPMNALRSICLREIEPLDRAEWTLSLIVPEYKPRPLRTSSTLNHDHLYQYHALRFNACKAISTEPRRTSTNIMRTSFYAHADEDEGVHENHATSSTNHGPISKIIPNPLTDTTTTISEGERPTIVSDFTGANNDKRNEDSRNSNTLTLNSAPKENENTTSFKKMSTSTQIALARQEGLGQDWEEIWEKERAAKWLEKVQVDLKGWRGGNGLVHLSLMCFSVTTPYKDYGAGKEEKEQRRIWKMADNQ